MKVNNEFLFGCATGVFDNWRGTNDDTERTGIKPMHAYSIMEAREVKGEKLLRVRSVFNSHQRLFYDFNVILEILGVEVSGTAPGVTALSSGRRSGCSS